FPAPRPPTHLMHCCLFDICLFLVVCLVFICDHLVQKVVHLLEFYGQRNYDKWTLCLVILMNNLYFSGIRGNACTPYHAAIWYVSPVTDRAFATMHWTVRCCEYRQPAGAFGQGLMLDCRGHKTTKSQ